MVQPQEDDISVEASSLPPVPIQEISEDRALTETVLFPTPKLFLKISKPEIRQSLRALTYESVFAAVLYSVIGGALLSNLLLELGAGPVEIGLLAAISQMVNLLQPLGAYDVPLPTVHTDISPRGSQTEIKGNCWTDRETKSYSGYRPSEVRFQSY